MLSILNLSRPFLYSIQGADSRYLYARMNVRFASAMVYDKKKDFFLSYSGVYHIVHQFSADSGGAVVHALTLFHFR